MMLRNPYKALEKALGYRFRRRKRLEQALTHPSFRHEQGELDEDNQRLEFLGDAALGLASAAMLYDIHKDLAEGELTQMRSRMTNTRALAAAAQRAEVGLHLRLGRGEEQNGGRTRESNLADAMEAILGAAFLDGGLKAVEKILRATDLSQTAGAQTGVAADNPKGALQESVQQWSPQSPVYRVVRETGPAHAREFEVEVLVDGEVCGLGTGRSKRDAECAAALEALAGAALAEIRRRRTSRT